MRILLTGANGQVGWELRQRLAALGDVLALDHAALDLADPDAIRRAVREARPDLIANAAAYTAVDRAEAEPELAMRVNGEAPGVLAEEAKRLGALLVHYSSDYVFDGEKRAPYVEDDATNPLNAYGASKLAGERAIAARGGRYLILRTSWVYAARGRNFATAILRLARERDQLRVVDDQVGAPTSSRAIAAATAAVVSHPRAREAACSGVYHCTAAGHTSWHGFARRILETGAPSVRIVPVSTEAYGAAARRPRYSVLGNEKLRRTFDVAMPGWEEQYETIRAELAAAAG